MATATPISKAFKTLRQAGFYARQNFSCCSGCAGYELATKAQACPVHKRPLGCVFYTRQDTPRETRWSRYPEKMYLKFGPLYTSGQCIGLPAADVGRLVCEALEEQGIEYEWDGNPNQCIAVKVATAF